MPEEWASLYRRLPKSVYSTWEDAERKAAARLGITVGEKATGGYVALYEALAQHLLQLENWENF